MKVLIIGGGPAGRIASLELGSMDEDVTLIEKKHLAGTCLNEGCMVICALNEVAKFINYAERFENLGVLEAKIKFSYKDIVSALKKTQELIRKINEKETIESGVNVVYGEAEIKDSKVYVDGKEYPYDKLIIATGARTKIPEIKGIEHALSHKALLELDEVPESIILIGSGIIASEIASIFASMGSDTYILCRGEFLKNLDDLGRRYVESKLLNKTNIIKNVEIKEILKDGVIITDEDSNEMFIQGTPFNTTGRRANSEIVKDLLETDENGNIIVNEKMETSVENIYAAGDVTGGELMTPIARMEGVIAARNSTGLNEKVNYNDIASSISLYMDVTSINLKEEEKNEYDVFKAPGVGGYGSFWNILTGDTGISEVYINKETKQLEKVLSIGPNTRLNVAYISFLMRMGIDIREMDNFVEVHPSTDLIALMFKYQLSI